MKELLSSTQIPITIFFVLLGLIIMLSRTKENNFYNRPQQKTPKPKNLSTDSSSKIPSSETSQKDEPLKKVAEKVQHFFVSGEDTQIHAEGSVISLKQINGEIIFIIDGKEYKDPNLIPNPKLRKRIQIFMRMKSLLNQFLPKQHKKNHDENPKI